MFDLPYTDPPAAVQQDCETEQQLLATARLAISNCNWTVGEAAAKWQRHHARGRSDADFGQLVNLSGDQVYQRRRVWEQFVAIKDDHAACKWSHFYVALNWADAAECLAWANANEATIAEMKAWRRMQNGEDLTVDADDDAPNHIGGEPDGSSHGEPQAFAAATAPGSDTCDTLSEALARTDAGTPDPAETAYAPYRAPAGRPPRDATREGSPRGTADDVKIRRAIIRTLLQKGAASNAADITLTAALAAVREGHGRQQENGELEPVDNATLDAIATMPDRDTK